jgi:hypothetical protein
MTCLNHVRADRTYLPRAYAPMRKSITEVTGVVWSRYAARRKPFAQAGQISIPNTSPATSSCTAARCCSMPGPRASKRCACNPAGHGARAQSARRSCLTRGTRYHFGWSTEALVRSSWTRARAIARCRRTCRGTRRSPGYPSKSRSRWLARHPPKDAELGRACLSALAAWAYGALAGSCSRVFSPYRFSFQCSRPCSR